MIKNKGIIRVIFIQSTYHVGGYLLNIDGYIDIKYMYDIA